MTTSDPPPADVDGLAVFADNPLPRWMRVRQELFSAPLADPAAAVAAEFQRPEIGSSIRPGAKIALGVGSRGIDRLAEVVRASVVEIRRRGGEPLIVPAMGSHGGATPEGQAEVLAGYGISAETMGCPLRSSLDVVQLGIAAGVPVWFDRNAVEADAVIPINRVKPHTDFRAPMESGLAKMIAIGLGKQRGSDVLHRRGFETFEHLIPEVAGFILGRVRIPFGLALVEDGHAQLSHLEAVAAERIPTREPELLALARERMARLPGERLDVLIVDRIGKDISGIGMDSNVVNRYYNGRLPGTPSIQRIVVRALTEATEGNACGLGLADVVLRRAVDRIDPLSTYMNSVTAKTPEGARIPITVPNDRIACAVALATCLHVDPAAAAIARIVDTKHLESFWASECLARELAAAGSVEPMGEPEEIRFDLAGMFADSIPFDALPR